MHQGWRETGSEQVLLDCTYSAGWCPLVTHETRFDCMHCTPVLNLFILDIEWHTTSSVFVLLTELCKLCSRVQLVVFASTCIRFLSFVSNGIHYFFARWVNGLSEYFVFHTVARCKCHTCVAMAYPHLLYIALKLSHTECMIWLCWCPFW